MATDAPTLQALAGRLADAAGTAIRPHFRAGVAVEAKADASPVTIADRAAEQAMREVLTAEVPEHGVRGEEFPWTEGDGEWVWYLDPIDGTKSFICGIPLFGTLIGLVRDGVAVLGVFDQPITKERWFAGIDGTASLNGQPISVSPCAGLNQAKLFTTGTDYYSPDKAAAFRRLSARVGLTRYGTDAYAFGMLAAGQIDLVTEADVNEHDVAALVPIIENAGGVITDWQGAPLRFTGAKLVPSVLAAGDAAVHAQAMAILND